MARMDGLTVLVQRFCLRWPRGVIAILLVAGVHGCTNYMVTRGASPDNSTQIAYNSDGQSLYGYMKHYPAAEHPAAGTQRQIWEFVSGKYLGSIPEAKTTYNVVGNTNEFGLTIAETTFDGLENLMTPAEGNKIDYYSLMWITLQRCRTAREAITTMDHLTQTYGYASTGESFSIADTSEVHSLHCLCAPYCCLYMLHHCMRTAPVPRSTACTACRCGLCVCRCGLCGLCVCRCGLCACRCGLWR